MAGTFAQHLEPQPDGSHRLRVRVTPNSRRAHIKADRTGVRVYVGEPSEDGRAIAAAIRALARQMGRPRSAFELLSGDTERDALFRIAP